MHLVKPTQENIKGNLRRSAFDIDGPVCIQQGPVPVDVRSAEDGALISLSPLDFHWAAPAVAARPGDYRAGQKGAIVEMFGWLVTQCRARAPPYLKVLEVTGGNTHPPIRKVSYQCPVERVGAGL